MISDKTTGVGLAAMGAILLYATASPREFYGLINRFIKGLNNEQWVAIAQATTFGPYVGIILIAAGILVFVRGMRTDKLASDETNKNNKL